MKLKRLVPILALSFASAPAQKVTAARTAARGKNFIDLRYYAVGARHGPLCHMGRRTPPRLRNRSTSATAIAASKPGTPKKTEMKLKWLGGCICRGLTWR